MPQVLLFDKLAVDVDSVSPKIAAHSGKGVRLCATVYPARMLECKSVGSDRFARDECCSHEFYASIVLNRVIRAICLENQQWPRSFAAAAGSQGRWLVSYIYK